MVSRKRAHSPLPWMATNEAVHDRNGHAVAIIPEERGSDKRWEANCGVLAAAPELLKVLRQILSKNRKTRSTGLRRAEAMLQTLGGGDLIECSWCDGYGHLSPLGSTEIECPECDGEGSVDNG